MDLAIERHLFQGFASLSEPEFVGSAADFGVRLAFHSSSATFSASMRFSSRQTRSSVRAVDLLVVSQHKLTGDSVMNDRHDTDQISVPTHKGRLYLLHAAG